MTQASIKNLLTSQSTALGTLLTQIKQLQRWNQWLAEALPNESKLLEHCHIVRLDQTALIVIADNPHWLTRFRFYVPHLMSALKQYPDFRQLKTITCKVRPLNMTAAPLQKKPMVLSNKNAELFHELAKKIQDSKLRQSLEKIGKTS